MHLGGHDVRRAGRQHRAGLELLDAPGSVGAEGESAGLLVDVLVIILVFLCAQGSGPPLTPVSAPKNRLVSSFKSLIVTSSSSSVFAPSSKARSP